MASLSANIRRIAALAAIFITLPHFAAAGDVMPINLEDELRHLDVELAKRELYISQREDKINELANGLRESRSTADSLKAFMEIGDTYNAFNNDSALVIYTRGYDRALQTGDSATATAFRLKRAMLLPLSGYFDDAKNEFDAIDPASLRGEQLELYHDAGRQMYSYIASFFYNYPTTRQYWEDKSSFHQDKLVELLDVSTPAYALNYGEQLIREGGIVKAKAVLTDLLASSDDSSNTYARAAHMLSTIAEMKGNEDEAVGWLARSAMADLRGAVLEVTSLQELGSIMSKRNDINRAYDYLAVALSNAVDCHATMRIVQSSLALPLIQATHNEQIESWRTRIILILLGLAVVLLVILALLFTLRSQMKKQKLLQQKLQSANQTKEVYISQFFRLCSIYIDKLNQFCQIANRKISSGQVDDLYKITKSGKLVQQQSEEFYKIFDDAFLHIFPTFVEDVNKLLSEKIILKEGELMNNDLRILAFLRLGLDDTNQVALILNYSVNTIYAYRNKLRNRAFNRDTFEAEVMKIGAL